MDTFEWVIFIIYVGGAAFAIHTIDNYLIEHIFRAKLGPHYPKHKRLLGFLTWAALGTGFFMLGFQLIQWGVLVPQSQFFLTLALFTAWLMGWYLYQDKPEPRVITLFPNLDNCEPESLEEVRQLEKAVYANPHKRMSMLKEPDSDFSQSAFDDYFIGVAYKQFNTGIPRDQFYNQHVQIVGPTRTGKGVVLQLLAMQLVSEGKGVIVLDPKCDQYLLPVLVEANYRNGERPFHLIDFAHNDVGGWHPFTSGTVDERISRIMKSCDLESDTGSDSDYYRAKVQRVITEGMNDGNSGRIDDLRDLLAGNADSKESRQLSDFEQWAQRENVCPVGEGFDLDRALENNDIIYVRGNTTDPRIRMPFQAFLMQITQWKLKHRTASPKTVFCDELPFYVGMDFARDIATTLEANLNFVFAYQSIKDLEVEVNARGGPGKAVYGKIDDNCKAKIYFGTQSPETVKHIVQLSGTRLFEDSTRTSTSDPEVRDRVSTRHVEKPRIPANLVSECPAGICFFFQQGQVPQLVHTSPVPLDYPYKPLEAWEDPYTKLYFAIYIDNLPYEDFIKKRDAKPKGTKKEQVSRHPSSRRKKKKRPPPRENIDDI